MRYNYPVGLYRISIEKQMEDEVFDLQ